MSARLYEDVVLEAPIHWADNRRIFACAGVSGLMLARLEIEANAIDDAVLDAIQYLHESIRAAQEASSQRASLSLVKDP